MSDSHLSLLTSCTAFRGGEMDPRMDDALKAIQDEVLKLLDRTDLPPDVRARVGLIESIARHGHDDRTDEEQSRQ